MARKKREMTICTSEDNGRGDGQLRAVERNDAGECIDRLQALETGNALVDRVGLEPSLPAGSHLLGERARVDRPGEQDGNPH